MAGDLDLTLTAKDLSKAAFASYQKSLENVIKAQEKFNTVSASGKSTTVVENSLLKRISAANELGKAYDKTAREAEKLAKAETKAVATANAAATGGGKFTGTGIAGMGMLGGVMRAFGLAASGYAVKQVAEWTAATAVIGAQVMDTEKSLDNLSRSYGVNGRAIVAQMQQMAHGSVVASDLMISVNRALMAQNPEIARALPKVFEIARAASIPAARDIQYVYDSLITGILRGSYRLIDNADIYLNIGDAVESYAASLGKTSDELSLQERQLSILNAVLSQGGEIVKNVDMSQLSYSEALQRVKVSATEAKQSIGEYLVVAAKASGITDTATGAARAVADTFQRRKQFLDIENQIRASDLARGKGPTTSEPFLGPVGKFFGQGQGGLDPVARLAVWAFGFVTASSAADDYNTRVAELARTTQQWIDVNPLYAMNGFTSAMGSASSAASTLVDRMNDLHYVLSLIRGDSIPGTIVPDLAANTFEDFLNRPLSNKERAAQISSGVTGALGGFFGPKIPLAVSEKAVREYGPQIQKAFNESLTGFDYKKATVLGQTLNEKVTGAWTQGIKDDSSKIKAAYDDMANSITGLLSKNLDVTATDMLATKIGKYVPKSNENTRRLADIVENGLEILKKHPEYQGQLGIPGEVMGNNDQLRYWASVELEKSKNLQRPQDIDPATFIAEFQASKVAEAERQNTINNLMKLVGGKGAGDRLQVAQQAGIATTKEDAAAQAEMWSKAFSATDVSAITVVTWKEMFKKDLAAYESIGTSLGSTIATAMVTALTANVGTVRQTIASLVAPEVAALLAKTPPGGLP